MYMYVVIFLSLYENINLYKLTYQITTLPNHSVLSICTKQRKCDMYWPKEGAKNYGFIQVKLLQEVVMATYILRTFTVKNLKLKKRAGSERTVYQYHYTNWPDHGVPDHPLPVLSFVRKSASANPPGAGAIICHCSAGCGRSGTYIVIDAMLKQIRHRQSINVFDFLKHIRSQRNYLVQTEEQYIFIHDSLVEALNCGETEIASNFIAKYIKHLQTGTAVSQQVCEVQQQQQQQQQANGLSQKGSSYSIVSQTDSDQPIVGLMNDQNSSSNQKLLAPNGLPVTLPQQQHANGFSKQILPTNNATIARTTNTNSTNSNNPSQWSLLERQYRLVASFKAKDFNVKSALSPCNKIKNRSLNLIPLEAHRVHITPKPGIDGSDYINASFFMGFNHLREFIVTQHPVHETFSDFWQMVYDHNSQIIVLLTSTKNQDCAQFWPDKLDEVDYGSFKVKLTNDSTSVIGGGGDWKGEPLAGPNAGLITQRDFIMRSNQDDYELQTSVIQCAGWPHCCGSLSGVFNLIQVVQAATQMHSAKNRMHDDLNSTTTVTIGQEHEPQNGGPIIVVDKFGGTDASTFSVLTTLYKQINFEDAVDVYMYAKLACMRRPGIWQTQDDYLFLYRAIENYASRMALAQQSTNSGIDANGNQRNFANQTMTLDRHRQKSAVSSILNTSTMRRPNSSAKNSPSANSNNNNKPAIGKLLPSPTKTNNSFNKHFIIPPTSQLQDRQTVQQQQQLVGFATRMQHSQQLQPVITAQQLQLQRQLQKPTQYPPQPTTTIINNSNE